MSQLKDHLVATQKQLLENTIALRTHSNPDENVIAENIQLILSIQNKITTLTSSEVDCGLSKMVTCCTTIEDFIDALKEDSLVLNYDLELVTDSAIVDSLITTLPSYCRVNVFDKSDLGGISECYIRIEIPSLLDKKCILQVVTTLVAS